MTISSIHEVITVKLWQFSLENVNEVIYLYSLRTTESFLRSQYKSLDHGTIDFSVFEKLFKEGRIKRIKNIEEVLSKDRDSIPFGTYEFDNSAFELTIEEYFNPPSYLLED